MITHTVSIAIALLGLLCSADLAGQARNVQVGYCSTLKNIDAAKAAGFDYLELGTSEIAALSDEEFEKAVAHIKEVGLPGSGDELVSPGRAQGDRARDESGRADGLRPEGIHASVAARHGNRRLRERRRATGARRVSKEEAFKQLVDFGNARAGTGPRDMTLAIEPLRRAGNQHHQLGGRGARAGQGRPPSQLSTDDRLRSSGE